MGEHIAHIFCLPAMHEHPAKCRVSGFGRR